MSYFKGIRRLSRAKMQELITNNQTDPDILYITPDNEQYDTMPAASADLNGVIAQYTGTTDGTYTNGYFYKCNGTGWERIDVQPDTSIQPLSGLTDPTTATAGEIGQTYTNLTEGKVFSCTAKIAQGTNPETYLYTWTQLATKEYVDTAISTSIGNVSQLLGNTEDL